MNINVILLVGVSALAVFPCCRPKPSEKISPAPNTSSEHEKIAGQVDTAITKDSNSIAALANSESARNQKYSYGNLDKELMTIQKKAGWPRNEQQELSYRESLRRLLERRKSLLFSVQIGTHAEMERNAAWKFLEFRHNLAIFTDDQNDYAKKLLSGFYSAPAIEKLVIWELVRIRMDYSMAPGGGRGLSGTGEILLRREMAKLLFSALGIEKQELFDAVDLKIRAASSEAETKASRAEEEIERIHIEQSKVAEKILEENWNLSP